MDSPFDRAFYNALPKDFHWGTATSAYQIEGAAAVGGRGPSIWDVFSHTEGKVRDRSNGDVACDHYHRYAADIQLMKDLDLEHYRFSLSWSRVRPSGRGNVNEEGLDFYDRLVDELLAAGITPFATLYHWDLPQALQEAGGWENRDTAFHFADHAEVVFRRLGDRVKQFVTHNEPWCVSVLGHYIGEHAPGKRLDAAATLTSAHHVLLSHGLAVDAFRASGVEGEIGITLNLLPVYPATQSPEDLRAARLHDVFSNAWFLDPLFKGAYPPELEDLFGPMPREVRPDDLAVISRPIDLLGVNFYSYNVVERAGNAGNAERSGELILPWNSVAPEERVTDMGWPVSAPTLTDMLLRLDREYTKLPIYITENGAAYEDQPEDGQVHDADRIAYVKDHLEAVAKAILGGVDVRGYYLWSFMDNFEWAWGYTKRFGMVYTDYATLARIPKDSALWYAAVIRAARAVAQG